MGITNPNLAGHPNPDPIKIAELDAARIPVEVSPEPIRGEVGGSAIGRLGPFAFERAWYYWMVDGLVPLRMAEWLYADPIGKTDVRVEGHCGCPAPDGCHLVWRNPTTGAHVHARFNERGENEQEKWERWVAEDPDLASDVKIEWADDPAASGAEAFVDGYHIDSAAGLRLFADATRAFGLAPD